MIGKNGVEHVLDIPLNEDEKERLSRSANTLSELVRSLDELDRTPALV